MKLKINIKNFEFSPVYFTLLANRIEKVLGDSKNYVYGHIRTNFFTFTSFYQEIIDEIEYDFKQNNILFSNVEIESIDKMKILTDKEHFKMSSPTFCRLPNSNSVAIFNDCEKYVKDTLIRKADSLNLNLGNFEITFENFNKTKLIQIEEKKYKCFVSGVKIEGSEFMKKFAQQVGLGMECEKGFGFIY